MVLFSGYTNEVGEAFRQLVPRVFVRFTFVVASTYCFSDALSKAQAGKLSAIIQLYIMEY